MTRPEPPSIKSLTAPHNHLNPAEPARTSASSGAPKAVAEGVLSALRTDPQTVTVTGIRPGLIIRQRGSARRPVADWLCACGHHERATGGTAVIELADRVQVGHCPHQSTETDRESAA